MQHRGPQEGEIFQLRQKYTRWHCENKMTSCHFIGEQLPIVWPVMTVYRQRILYVNNRYIKNL